jgi:hypothetical protein
LNQEPFKKTQGAKGIAHSERKVPNPKHQMTIKLQIPKFEI